MKRLTVILTILVLAITCVGCACGKSNNSQIGNPWNYDASTDDVKKLTGQDFIVPSGATDVTYAVLESEKLAEMNFTLNGINYTLRMEPTPDLKDISGLYYEWDVEGVYNIDGIEFKARTNNSDHICNVLWRQGDISYSLTNNSGNVTDLDLVNVAKQLSGIAAADSSPSAYQ